MGKTTFIKKMIEKKTQINPSRIVYHIDTKQQGDFSSRDGTIIKSEKAPRTTSIPATRIVWQPTSDNKEEYSNFFMSILQQGVPAIVNIDESVNMEFDSGIPRGLEILLKQGRLPGIDVYLGTQEVAGSPRQAHSQAQHIACFFLANEYDVRIMANRLGLGKGVRDLGLKRFEFLYRRIGIDNVAKKYSSYHELLGSIH